MISSLFTLGILSAFFALGFTDPSEGESAPVVAKANLKVMTYNIHHCNPLSEKGKIDVEALQG